MRRFFISLFLATSCSSVSQASPCMTGAERLAFDVIALKSDLMVGALSCDVGEQYDAFMVTFQPFIAAEQRVMDGYFARVGGPAAVGQEDDYVTLLANSQSDASLREGSGYCGQNSSLLGAIGGLSVVGDLVGFLAANPPPEPIDLAVCGVGGAPVAPAAPVGGGGLVTADNAVAAPAGGEELASDAAPVPAAPEAAAPVPAAPELGTPVAAGHTPIAPAVAGSVAAQAEKSLFRAEPLAAPPGDKSGVWSHPYRNRAVTASVKHGVPVLKKPAPVKVNPYAATQVI